MNTLKQFSTRPTSLPTLTSWLLADLSEARGKQDLFTKQSPQKLKALRENALVESAISSNRIEGVEVDQSRVATLVFGKSPLQDRSEEEIRGYRDALRLIHEKGSKLPITVATIKRLHTLCQGGVWDAGKFKEKPVDIIQTYPDGRRRVRFTTVSPKSTPKFMAETCNLWVRGLKEKWVPRVLLIPALNLDFLCIHPFRDGNGRVSRLLLLLSLYHCGFEVGRYISLERMIEENKERYYETLEQCSQGWHGGNHDPWPFINFTLSSLNTACREFELRAGQMTSPKGAKAEMVIESIRSQTGEFRLIDIEKACPGVGREWIRVLLAELKKSGQVTCRGRGPAARWRFAGNTLK